MKFKFKEENVQVLLKDYNQLKGNPDGFGQIVQKMYINKQITDQDVLELQNRGMHMGDMVVVSGYITTNGKMYYNEALELARKYHLLLLTICEKENNGRAYETFKLYEDSVDTIYNGTFDGKLLDFLKLLDNHTNFDKEKTWRLYINSDFKDKLL